LQSCFMTEQKNYFVTDGRFEFQAAQETEGFEVVVYGEGLNYFSQTGKLAAEAGVKQCTICGADLTFDDYQDLVSQAPDTKFVSEGLLCRTFTCDQDTGRNSRRSNRHAGFQRDLSMHCLM